MNKVRMLCEFINYILCAKSPSWPHPSEQTLIFNWVGSIVYNSVLLFPYLKQCIMQFQLLSQIVCISQIISTSFNTHNFFSIFSFTLVLFTCFLLTTLVITLWSTLNDHKTYIMAVVVVDLTKSGLIHRSSVLSNFKDTSIWLYGWRLHKRFAYLRQEG